MEPKNKSVVRHIMGGDHETHLNWEESLGESLALIALGTVIVLITRKLLNRLEYLEGLLHICSFCRKINVGDEWITLEEYVQTCSDTMFSHGFCPDCGQKQYGEYLSHHKSVAD